MKDESIDSTELVTTDEVARRLSVSPSTVRMWVYSKKIPFIRLGKLVRFRPAVIDAWVLEREHQSGKVPR